MTKLTISRRVSVSMAAVSLLVGSALGFGLSSSLSGANAATSTCPDVSSCLAESRSHSQSADAAAARAQSFLAATTTSVAPTTTVPGSTVPPTTTTTTTTIPSGGTNPVGAPGTWHASFADEFNGTALDLNKWNTFGSWECCDGGRSNIGNGELDYKTQPPSKNYTFGLGALTIHGIREAAPGGQEWTGGQLGSKQAFTYGFIETRAQFSPTTGFQPALWTWGAPGTNVGQQETDVFEFYGDNHSQLYLTSHATGGGGCHYTMPFDPTTGLHVYGADIEPTGTDWYVDGIHVCHAAGHPTQAWNIVAYQVALASWRAPTPAASTTHAEYVTDYIRAWQH